jgi:hypothetical protein
MSKYFNPFKQPPQTCDLNHIYVIQITGFAGQMGVIAARSAQLGIFLGAVTLIGAWWLVIRTIGAILDPRKEGRPVKKLHDQFGIVKNSLYTYT